VTQPVAPRYLRAAPSSFFVRRSSDAFYEHSAAYLHSPLCQICWNKVLAWVALVGASAAAWAVMAAGVFWLRSR
jgi:hypothetical protein